MSETIQFSPEELELKELIEREPNVNEIMERLQQIRDYYEKNYTTVKDAWKTHAPLKYSAELCFAVNDLLIGLGSPQYDTPDKPYPTHWFTGKKLKACFESKHAMFLAETGESTQPMDNVLELHVLENEYPDKINPKKKKKLFRAYALTQEMLKEMYPKWDFQKDSRFTTYEGHS